MSNMSSRGFNGMLHPTLIEYYRVHALLVTFLCDLIILFNKGDRSHSEITVFICQDEIYMKTGFNRVLTNF